MKGEKKLILTEEKLDEELNRFSEKILSRYNRKESKDIQRAVEWAQEMHSQQKRASGEPYIIHPVKTAEILVDFGLDATTIIAALLHDVLEDTNITLTDMSERFGDEVAMLVDGVTKITLEHVTNKDMQKAETIRKMVLAMVKDLRVIFIKLADKRHNMNTLQHMSPEKRKRISQDCLEIFAPLAGKLGMNSLRTELEDLSLKFLYPEIYSRIKKFVAHKKEARSVYLSMVKKQIQQIAQKNKLKVKVITRAKHFYSIYKKMKDKGKSLDEIYDALGVRILCESTTACYTMLGLVHQLWPPVEGRFKDYIGMPKDNNYQSLHTTVMGDEGRRLEVQIRTFLMHEIAEYGLAAHLVYKEKKRPEHVDPQSWQFVEKIRLLHEQGYDSTDFLNSLKKDILEDSIVVYTPKGDPKLLPVGSTAIDFAYHIHSEVGDHCSGAKVNGNIIPLTRPLKNTETVSILTNPKAHPHIKWLKYVKTTSARSKIKNWLNKHDSSVIIDRNVVAIQKPESEEKKKVREEKAAERVSKSESNTMMDPSKVGIRIGNERNLMIKIAGCCQPVPGDEIIGFVSRGRGIIVHKPDCPNLKGINDFEERKTQVEWESFTNKVTRSFKIRANNKPALFSEIEGAIRKYGGHLIAGSLKETERGEIDGQFSVEMDKADSFKKIMRSIRTIPSVLNVSRTQLYDSDDDD